MQLFNALETQCIAPPYFRKVCAYAKRFDIGQVIAMTGEWDQHTFLDYREFDFPREDWEIDYAHRYQAAVREATTIAHEHGLRFLMWRHELSMHPNHIRQLNPQILDYCYGSASHKLGNWGQGTVDIELGFFDPDDDALWDYVRRRFALCFEAAPEVDGVVLTCLTETKLPLWNLSKHVSKAEVLARMLRIAYQACETHGKQLIVRNWGAFRDPRNPMGHVLLDAMDAAELPDDVFVMEKSYEPDFALGYPPNAGVAQCASRRATVVELELENETEGMCTVPVCAPMESKIAIQHARAHGCHGFVARMDGSPDTTQWQSCATTLENVNEINLYAAVRLMGNPELEVDELWHDWAREHFDEDMAAGVIDVLKPTFDFGLQAFFCQGNVMHTGYFSIEPALNHLRSYARYHYTQLPADHRWMEALQSPTTHDLEEFVAEKQRAVDGYRQGLQALGRLPGKISREWYQRLYDAFEHGVNAAQVQAYYAEIVIRFARYKHSHCPTEAAEIQRLLKEARQYLNSARFPNRTMIGRVNSGMVDTVVWALADLDRFEKRFARLTAAHTDTPIPTSDLAVT